MLKQGQLQWNPDICQQGKETWYDCHSNQQLLHQYQFISFIHTFILKKQKILQSHKLKGHTYFRRSLFKNH